MASKAKDQKDIQEWLNISTSDVTKLISRSSMDELKLVLRGENFNDAMDIVVKNVYTYFDKKDVDNNLDVCKEDCDVQNFDCNLSPKTTMYGADNSIVYIKKVLTDESCDEVLEYYNSKYEEHKKVDVTSQESKSMIFHDHNFAREMGIITTVLNTKVCDRLTATDWWQYNRDNDLIQYHSAYRPMVDPIATNWNPISVSPSIVFNSNTRNNYQFPCYNKGHIFDNSSYRTLMTGVLYLSDNESAVTRFINDGQEDVDVWKRNHATHTKKPDDKDVIRSFNPEKGSVLIFDNKLCHDTTKHDLKSGNNSFIIFNVIFEANP